MPYRKWATSKVQHQFNLTKFPTTASSLTQVYNSNPKLWTCPFIGFVIDTDKKIHVHWKQLKQNLSDYPEKHHSTKHQISDKPTYVLNTIQKKTETLFKLPKIPTTLQGCVQTHFRQPLNNRWITDLQCHQYPLRQCWTNNAILHDNLSAFPKQTVQTYQLEPMASFEHSPFRNKQICR